MFKTPNIPVGKKAKNEPPPTANNPDSGTHSQKPESSKSNNDQVDELNHENNASTEESKSPSIPQYPPLNYKPPQNRFEPIRQYTFDVLRQGSLLETLKFSMNQDYFVAGRLPNCDFVLDHPSISRYHAVIQFCDDGQACLYDLGSTHKTFVNKQPILSRTLFKLCIGDQIRFGMSTRVFIFSTADTDHLLEISQEMEMKYDQAKNFAKAKLKSALKSDPNSEVELNTNPNTNSDLNEASGQVTWGFGEDAVDSDIIDINSISIIPQNSNAFYNSDPKAALHNFLQKKGYSMEFETSFDNHSKEFVSKILLPIQDRSGNALFGIGQSSKKKDSHALAALNACQMIDKAGLFAEGKKNPAPLKEKYGNNSDDDDDDIYYDRTAKKDVEKNKINTFDSLNTERNAILSNIQNLEKEKNALQLKLNRSQDMFNNNLNDENSDDDGDDIDTYVQKLQNDTDKDSVAKLDVQLGDLKKKILRIEKLIEIARPTKSSDMILSVSKASSGSGSSIKLRNIINTNSNTNTPESVKEAFTESVTSYTVEHNKDPQNETGIKAGAETETETETRPSTTPFLDRRIQPAMPSEPHLLHKSATLLQTAAPNAEKSSYTKTESKKRKIGPTLPGSVEHREKSKSKPQPQASVPSFYDYENSDETWVPPSGQSGDGRTHLNDKYGY